jgi:hypothetical protein
MGFQLTFRENRNACVPKLSRWHRHPIVRLKTNSSHCSKVALIVPIVAGLGYAPIDRFHPAH